MPATASWSDVKIDVTELKGGLDQLTPTLSLKPSFCREAVNFECSVTGGYTRIGGYERMDGRAKPSDASYGIVQVTSFVNAPSIGGTLTGATSGATGKVIGIGDDYLVLTQLVGTFVDGEIVSIGVPMIGLTTALTINLTPLQNAVYLNLAADVYRALIGPVPGSGPVRGVVSAIFSGVHKVYAFRDNLGASACVMHEATGSGWSPVTLHYSVEFSAGAVAIPADGNTLTQGGNTATIRRVVLESGTWNDGDAAGRLIIAAPTPGNFAAGAATIGATTLTLAGIQTAISFLPGGKFEFDIANFSGQLTTRRIYGCDGANKAFEFDGSTVVPIRTGASVDTPKHIKAHHFHLMLTVGSSIMISSLGLPYQFLASGGALEIAVGDTITGLLIQPGNQDTATMAVFSRNASGMLYGTSVSNFKFVSYTSATGGIDYMAQNLEQSYVLDDRGLVSLAAAQEYGNFLQSTLTQRLQTYVSEKQSLSLCSSVSKDKSQYRAFFSDGSGLYVTIVNGKFQGAMPILFPDAMNCAWNGELANGNDVSYVGALAGGYVYQLDKGSSFDGANIDASITLNWNFLKTPRTIKRFRGASVEMQGEHYASIQFNYALGYNSELIDQPQPVSYDSNLGGAGQWDVSSWDAFIWDGRTLSPTEVEMGGRAENVQIILASTTDYIYPFTVNSVVTHYSLGRPLR